MPRNQRGQQQIRPHTPLPVRRAAPGNSTAELHRLQAAAQRTARQAAAHGARAAAKHAVPLPRRPCGAATYFARANDLRDHYILSGNVIDDGLYGDYIIIGINKSDETYQHHIRNFRSKLMTRKDLFEMRGTNGREPVVGSHGGRGGSHGGEGSRQFSCTFCSMNNHTTEQCWRRLKQENSSVSAQPGSNSAPSAPAGRSQPAGHGGPGAGSASRGGSGLAGGSHAGAAPRTGGGYDNAGANHAKAWLVGRLQPKRCALQSRVSAGQRHERFKSYRERQRAALCEWYLDTGASLHICNNISLFDKFTPDISEVDTAGGDELQVLGSGTVTLYLSDFCGSIELRNVLYAPAIVANLISLVQFVNEGGGFSMERNGIVLRTQSGNRYTAKTDRIGGVPYLIGCVDAVAAAWHDSAHVFNAEPTALITRTVDISNPGLWHARCGHPSYGRLARLPALVDGFNLLPDDIKAYDSQHTCESCALTKSTRQPYPSAAPKDLKPGELLHSDVGTIPVRSAAGFKYYMTLVDDATGYSFFFALKAKSEVADRLVAIIPIETKTGNMVKVLRSDNGGEYVAGELNKFLASKGIIHHREARHAAQNKDVRERGFLRNRRGGYARPDECSGNPLQPEPGSPLYAAEANRFYRDVAGELKAQKQQKERRQQELYDRKRQEGLERESARWKEIDAERAAEAERMAHVREAGTRGKQNKSSEHFNIITLNYHPTKEGQRLQQKARRCGGCGAAGRGRGARSSDRPRARRPARRSDAAWRAPRPRPAARGAAVQDEMTRYRAELRSQNLFNKSHSVPHNIITGEARSNPVRLPAAPAPPPLQ
ncbi:RE1 [Scenedesmus sp. PABB004]|nr:RE1 [Scenedesmus sp. PABB004]